jgi:hypothetical protein
MATITSVGTVARIEDDVYGTSGFSYRNQHWAAPDVAWGNFNKAGNSLVSNHRYVMDIPIPASSKIVSAKMEGVPASTQSGVFLTYLQMLRKDGLWDPAGPVGPQWNRGSRPNVDAEFRIKIESTAAAVLKDYVLTFTGAGWEMRANAVPGHFDRLGNGFVVSATAALGFATWKLSRQPTAPVGNIWAEVYTSDVNGLADTLLATSTTRLASAIVNTGNGADFRFTFPVGQRPTLVADGTVYVVVLRGDYPVSATSYVRAQWEGGVVGQTGWPQMYSSSFGFDAGAYPFDNDFRQIPIFPNSVFVTLPTWTAGVPVDLTAAAPTDLTIPVQSFVNDATYLSGDAFGISVRAWPFGLPSSARRDLQSGASFSTLTIQWKKRSVRTSA